MFGLGKNRSSLGKWLDDRGISQQWLSKKSKVGSSTISNLCSANCDHEPTQRTMKKVLNAIREIDNKVKADDFWDM